MTIILSDQYPGRANAPSVDYPYGSFKNQSAPGAKDGTPLEGAWANDELGFFQSLLNAASVVANGQVDKVGESQLYDALLQVISDTAPLPSQATDLVAGIAKVATSAILSAGTNDDSFATAKGLKDSGLWPLGVGQTYQDVKASRAVNTNYTNTTGRTIVVFASIGNSTIQTNRILVDGLVVGEWVDAAASSTRQGVIGIIPSGSVYRVENLQGSTTVLTWSELR